MFDPQWTEGSLRPLIHTAIDVFSPQRCMFGSNFPVDKLYTSYSALWQAYSSLTADLTAEQRACLFSETARQFYRLV